MSNKPFRFKQFEVSHSQSAMKVGVDSVLLGSILSFGEARNILDIGSGCGLLSLMVAQKTTKSTVIAIEIDLNAYHESKLNIENSPWADRVKVERHDVNEFHSGNKFDFIISNPPYFQNSTKNADKNRNLARQSDGLSLELFFVNIKRLLQVDGVCSFIYPADLKPEIIGFIEKYGFYLNEIISVIPKVNKEVNRHIYTISFVEKSIQAKEITIRSLDNKYTEEYKNVTRPFYL